MRKLMSANLSRLWKDKIFRIGMLTILACSIVNMRSGCRQATLDMSEFNYTLDHFYFAGMPFIGIFIAAFIGLLLGTEYSDGTMRNKLIVGHTRTNVYLANLITTFIASLMMLAAWFIGGLVGIPTLGTWQMGISGLMVYIFISILMVAAMCAIFTPICMISTNKAVTAVFCILLCLGIILSGSMFYNALCEPEMFSGVVVTADGMQIGDPAPNPGYVSGMKRTVYEFMADFIPTGQSIQMADLAVAHPSRMILCSAFIVIMTTLGGVIIFKHKDLK